MCLEKLVKKTIARVSDRHMRFSGSGKALIVFTLGSWFSRELMPYWRWIVLGGAFLTLFYVVESAVRGFRRKKMPFGFYSVGGVGLMLVMLFAGMQFTNLQFRPLLLLVGIVMTLPALADYVQRGK